ncbi:hypothetical protein OR392_000953 [Salmonella enterica subsp. enterica serovar Anatum]|nr:hypothetical protein [Salmonella enterica subsp. enterica serovar Anatum]
MINQNLTLKEKVLGAARLLHENAFMPVDDSRTVRPDIKPGMIAADAIEQLVKENEELRARIIATQRALNPAVTVDLAGLQNAATPGHMPFTKGDRVFLKSYPARQGTVACARVDHDHRLLCFVCFDSGFETDRWVKAEHLELIPDE